MQFRPHDLGASCPTFYDYAPKVWVRPRKPGGLPPRVMLESLETSDFTGDLLSQEVVQGEDVEKIPEVQGVKLPDAEFAKAWGELRK